MTPSFNIPDNLLTQNFPDLSNIFPLSQGGQKVVYRATHSHNGAVALKIMLPMSDPERTKREILAVRQIGSNRIPTIHGNGTIRTAWGDCFWFLEELIEGNTLRDYVSSSPLSYPELLLLALQIVETLTNAEQVSIVHRDVKPDNVMRSVDANFWLIDFGLARHLGLDSLTATAAHFGNVTWGYAPLEQCKNIKQEIDARADLFALGVTLYECATGDNPFRAGARDALEVLNRVENITLPKLNFNEPTGREFADFVATLTQKYRIHRPNTAREAYEWIQEICSRAGVQ